jgi:hypothetical protein
MTQAIKKTFVVKALLAAVVMLFAMSSATSAEATAPQPDLSIDVSGSSTAVIGDNIKSLSLTVSNQGDPIEGTKVDGYQMKMVLNTTWAGYPAAPFTIVPDGIPTGNFWSKTFDNVIPVSDQSGNSLKICAEVEFAGFAPLGYKDPKTFTDDGKGGAMTVENEVVFDSDYSNNKDCHTIEFLKPPTDLSVDVSGSSTAVIGEKIESLSITVSNPGGTMAPSLSKVLVNTTWAGYPLQLTLVPTSGIPTGNFHKWTFDNVILASSFWGDSLEICAEVEFEGGGAYAADGTFVIDSNPSNNKACHTIGFLNQ